MITIKHHLGYKPDKNAICPGQCLLSLYRSGHLENLSVSEVGHSTENWLVGQRACEEQVLQPTLFRPIWLGSR